MFIGYLFQKWRIPVKKGFTLAEVLITMSILSIIASMTIGGTNKIIDNANKTAWKKTFSQLTQVSIMIVQENGSYLEKATSDDELNDLFRSKLKYAQNCTAGSVEGNCWSSFKPDPMAAYACTEETGNEAATPNPTSAPDGSGFIMNNGQFMRFYNLSEDCDDTSDGIASCGRIEIDVNGFRGPNTYGKDIFAVHILQYGLAPFGYNDSKSCNDTDQTGCALTYLQ